MLETDEQLHPFCADCWRTVEAVARASTASPVTALPETPEKKMPSTAGSSERREICGTDPTVQLCQSCGLRAALRDSDEGRPPREPMLRVVAPWEMQRCRCGHSASLRTCQVPGEELPRCFECLKPREPEKGWAQGPGVC